MTHTVRVNVGSIDRLEVVEARESVGEGVRGPLSEKIDTTRLYNHPGTKQIRDAIERRNQLVQ